MKHSIPFLAFLKKRLMLRASRYPQPARHGYIFLMSILAIGTMATAATVTLMLLGIAAEQNGFTVVQSMQSLELARACAERGISALRINPVYAGNETVSFPQGSCRILSVGGAGFENRTVCAEGASGDTIRRIAVSVYQLFPTVRIRSWREVPDFALCP